MLVAWHISWCISFHPDKLTSEFGLSRPNAYAKIVLLVFLPAFLSSVLSFFLSFFHIFSAQSLLDLTRD